MPLSLKHGGTVRNRELISPSPPPVIDATPKTADAANALIDFASTGSLGGRFVVQAHDSADDGEAGVVESGVPDSIASGTA
jgi:hypothetical protein